MLLQQIPIGSLFIQIISSIAAAAAAAAVLHLVNMILGNFLAHDKMPSGVGLRGSSEQ